MFLLPRMDLEEKDTKPPCYLSAPPQQLGEEKKKVIDTTYQRKCQIC